MKRKLQSGLSAWIFQAALRSIQSRQIFPFFIILQTQPRWVPQQFPQICPYSTKTSLWASSKKVSTSTKQYSRPCSSPCLGFRVVQLTLSSKMWGNLLSKYFTNVPFPTPEQPLMMKGQCLERVSSLILASISENSLISWGVASSGIVKFQYINLKMPGDTTLFTYQFRYHQSMPTSKIQKLSLVILVSSYLPFRTLEISIFDLVSDDWICFLIFGIYNIIDCPLFIWLFLSSVNKQDGWDRYNFSFQRLPFLLIMHSLLI